MEQRKLAAAGAAPSAHIDQILDIASHQSPNEKSKLWSRDMVCVDVPNEGSNMLRVRKRSEYQRERDYIAVSYSCTPTPGLEDTKKGSYAVLGSQGRYPRRSRVRDKVLERVFAYAKAKGVRRFWVDKECSPQRGSEEKPIAMDSMDLFYSGSRYTVGVLAIILQDQDEINFLQALMMGLAVLQEGDQDCPRLAWPAPSRFSQGVFDMLAHLFKDRWWTRAWIFQEEYLSSTKMHLLIRRQPWMKVIRQFGFLQGEICLDACEFRKQATMFLLAFKRETHDRCGKRCAKMLKRFGRYEVQYRFQTDTKRRAMSARIFADIQRRKLDQESDRLAIVANSCNYGARLISKEMRRQGYNVDLCLLALYLLNGEILRNGRKIKKSAGEMDITNYIQYVAFNKFTPPGKTKHLTFLKECRLGHVSLDRSGRLTEGYLWYRAGVSIRPSQWPRRLYQSRKRHCRGLNDFQRGCFLQLTETLREQGFNVLCSSIEAYLEADMTNARRTAAKRYMNLMADSVVEAIRVGTPLHVASSKHAPNSCGIFAGQWRHDAAIFTSWHAGLNADGRWRQNHVSLKVQITQHVEGVPVLDAVDSVNGLVFFKRSESIPVIFGWPQAWASLPAPGADGARGLIV